MADRTEYTEELIWLEPNPNASHQRGYNPLNVSKPALRPGSCPCDNCPQRVRCRDEALACQVYDEWVNPCRQNARADRYLARRIPGKQVFNGR